MNKKRVSLREYFRHLLSFFAPPPNPPTGARWLRACDHMYCLFPECWKNWLFSL